MEAKILLTGDARTSNGERRRGFHEIMQDQSASQALNIKVEAWATRTRGNTTMSSILYWWIYPGVLSSVGLSIRRQWRQIA